MVLCARGLGGRVRAPPRNHKANRKSLCRLNVGFRTSPFASFVTRSRRAAALPKKSSASVDYRLRNMKNVISDVSVFGVALGRFSAVPGGRLAGGTLGQ